MFHIAPLIMLLNDKYKKSVDGSEIYHSIRKSKTRNSSKKLIIGDSVGKQLFDNYKFTYPINSLACNQSIGMIGQYILLDNYLNNGNKVDSVFLILNPFSFNNNLDQVYTYHYFLKPFYNKENLNRFSNLALSQISQIPYSAFCNYPPILTSNWAPKFQSIDKSKYPFLSPISIEYLGKIRDLAVIHKFKLVLIPTPISYEAKKHIKSFKLDQIDDKILNTLLGQYLNKVIYLDKAKFIDGVHLKHPDFYTELYKTKYLN
jgi:hypothetical protein